MSQSASQSTASAPCDSLVITSRDPALDRVLVQALRDAGHSVQLVPGADFLATLAARTQPAVVVKNLDSATGQWERVILDVPAAAPVTSRFAYVLVSLYPEWLGQLRARFPANHDIAVVLYPFDLPDLFAAVAQAGERVRTRWAVQGDQEISDLSAEQYRDG